MNDPEWEAIKKKFPVEDPRKITARYKTGTYEHERWLEKIEAHIENLYQYMNRMQRQWVRLDQEVRESRKECCAKSQEDK